MLLNNFNVDLVTVVIVSCETIFRTIKHNCPVKIVFVMYRDENGMEYFQISTADSILKHENHSFSQVKNTFIISMKYNHQSILNLCSITSNCFCFHFNKKMLY